MRGNDVAEAKLFYHPLKNIILFPNEFDKSYLGSKTTITTAQTILSFNSSFSTRKRIESFLKAER